MSLWEVYHYWFALEWIFNWVAVTTQHKERASCTSTNSGSCHLSNTMESINRVYCDESARNIIGQSRFEVS